jgi:hypothetical protein
LSLEVACVRAREAAARWFLESGIQEPSGGVARYYRTDLGRNHRISTEITGYAVSFLTWLFRLTGEPRLLEAATRAGNFLVRQAWDPEAALFPFEYAMDGDSAEPLAYFFDNAIVVRGLLALWRVTGRSELLETAARCGQTMAREFDTANGFSAALWLPTKVPAPRDERWSRNPGCYHLKAALAWRELALAGVEGNFQEFYRRALRYAVATHEQFLPATAEPAVMDRLHAYSYFLEGLLACADEPECRQTLRNGIERARERLEQVAPLFERGDVRAQLLRVRLFADALGIAPLAEEEAEREVGRILEFQADDQDPRVSGGFYFGRTPSGWLPFVNPYTTAFAVQALEMWRQHRMGQFQPQWQELI